MSPRALDPNGVDGKFFYAGEPSELKAAFQTLRDQIIRLTQ